MAAVIDRKRVPLPFGRFRDEYTWINGWHEESLIAKINLHLAGDLPAPMPKIGEPFWLGHLELVVVDFHPEMRLWEVALAGGRGYQAAYRRQLFYFWENLRSRIILTLYVWGLADAPMGDILTWKHVHWGRK